MASIIIPMMVLWSIFSADQIHIWFFKDPDLAFSDRLRVFGLMLSQIVTPIFRYESNVVANDGTPMFSQTRLLSSPSSARKTPDGKSGDAVFRGPWGCGEKSNDTVRQIETLIFWLIILSSDLILCLLETGLSTPIQYSISLTYSLCLHVSDKLAREPRLTPFIIICRFRPPLSACLS